MFYFALLIGIYSYIIFTLGIAGLLYKNLIIWTTLVYWLVIFYIYRKKLIGEIKNLKRAKTLIKDKLLLLILFIFVLQAAINLIGALGPELAFDALWYHLTLPKLYLENNRTFFIPGGLLYYSAMPKLGEMLYTATLAFNTEIFAKVIHYSFGILTCLAIYKVERKFFNLLVSMIGVVIFYSNLVVAWESITTYVDLIRTFLEIMSLWAFINWWEKEKRKWLVLSAIMVGLAITTKLLALGSVLIFTSLISYKEYSKSKSKAGVPSLKNLFIRLLTYLLIALAVPIPWFIFAYISTGNLVYPFFSEVYKVTPEPLSVTGFFIEIWNIFTNSPDPLSPLYMIFFPLIILIFYKFKPEIKIITLYTLLALVVWYFTPRTGGGRFILPYLPALSVVCAAVINYFIENKTKSSFYFSKIIIIIVIFTSLISVGYRLGANSKYIPVLLRKETKQQFLTNNLNFPFGDFYDTDNFFKNNINDSDRVLLIGFHNLYYVNFPFIDSSWLKAGDKFNYIAVQNTFLPEKYKNWKLIYTNTKTMVKLYKR